MVHQGLFFLLFLGIAGHVWGQDERYYRQILSGELPVMTDPLKVSERTQFNVSGPKYKFDLNGDGIEETIIPQKRDGVDWLEIRNSSGGIAFEAKLRAWGVNSSIYKLKLVHLNKTTKGLLIFLDEGVTDSKRVESTARFFVLTFENNDFKTFSLIEGPHIFHEKEAQREQYWRRDYNVNIYDIDGDGTREIAVQYNHINRIMKYLGNGNWKRY